MSKASFVPVGAMQGVNLASRDSSDAAELRKWYQGPTLVDLLGKSPSKLSASHRF
jgi:elongation factor 1 alpha-like protein